MRANQIIWEGFIGYELDSKSRDALLSIFAPKYPTIKAHHITYNLGTTGFDEMPSPEDVKVVGYADDGNGIEALVVTVNGLTTQADGRPYHITWSLDTVKGYKPVDSNTLIQNQGYQKIDPINISVSPKIFK